MIKKFVLFSMILVFAMISFAYASESDGIVIHDITAYVNDDIQSDID